MSRGICATFAAVLLLGGTSASPLGFEVHSTSLCGAASLDHDVVLAGQEANLTECTRVSLDGSAAHIRMACNNRGDELVVYRYQGHDTECTGGTEFFKAAPSNAEAFFRGSCSVVRVTRADGQLDDRLFAKFKSSYGGELPACVGAGGVSAQELLDWAQTWDSWELRYECGEIQTGTWRTLVLFYVLYMVGMALVLAATLCMCHCCCRSGRSAAVGVQPRHGPGGDDPNENIITSLEAAVEHLIATSPVDSNGQWRSIFFTPIKEIGSIGGAGVELYFRLLHNLGFVFLYMAGLTLPTVVMSSLGDFAPDKGQRVHKTTIGNLGSPAAGGISQANRYVIVGCMAMHVTEVTEKLGWCDFAATVVFMAFILDFRFRRAPRAQWRRAKELACQDFAVEVDCLPPKIGRMEEYEKDFRSHLMARLQFLRAQAEHRGGGKADGPPPSISEVVLVRNFGGRLTRIKKRAALIRQKEICEVFKAKDEADRLARKIDQESAKLGQFLDERGLLSEEALPVIRAFVTLNTPRAAAMLLHDYRFSNYTLFRWFQAESLRFRKTKAIRVRRAPAPTDILWENQDIPFRSRLCRKSAICLATLVIIVASLGVIYALSIAAKSYSRTSQNFFQEDTCDPVGQASPSSAHRCLILEASNWTDAHARAEGGDVLDCYCLTKGYTTIFRNRDLITTCMDWLIDIARDAAILSSAACIVVLINIVVKFALRYLTVLGGSRTFSDQDKSIMDTITVALILNTGFVTFLVNLWIGETLQDIITPFPGGAFIGRGDFNDFVRGWYSHVGVGLLMNMTANAVVPALQSLLAMAWTFMKRRFFVNQVILDQKTYQRKLTELYTNPSFNISTKYAQLIMTVFVTLTFSPGLPLLNILAAVFMFITYWVDKTVLLWGSRRPPSYDMSMPRAASMKMIWAVPMHLVFAIIMFGQPCTFPSGYLGHAAATITDRGVEQTESASGWVGARLFLRSTWMFSILLFAFAAGAMAWAFAWILGNSVGRIFQFIVLYCCASQRSTAAMDVTWDAAKEHIAAVMPPASYSLGDSPNYSRLARFLRGDSHITGEAWPGGAGDPRRFDGAVPPSDPTPESLERVLPACSPE